MKKPAETDLVRTVLTYLRIQYPQGLWFRQNTGAVTSEYKGRKRFTRFGVPGMSDIQGVLGSGPKRGLAVFIECKATTGKQSSNQKAFEKAAINAGALYLEVRDLDDLKILSDLV